MWEKGEGGRIVQTLAKGLLLPDDVHTFEEWLEESMGRRLQWHTIVVTLYLLIFYCAYTFIIFHLPFILLPY